MLTATGSPAMWVGYVSMFTANAVVVPPRPPGPMPKLVDFCQELFLHLFHIRNIGMGSPTPRQCVFCHDGTFFKVPPMPTPTTTGGQAWGLHPDSGNDRFFDAFDAVCRFQHKDLAHIFTAEAPLVSR